MDIFIAALGISSVLAIVLLVAWLAFSLVSTKGKLTQSQMALNAVKDLLAIFNVTHRGTLLTLLEGLEQHTFTAILLIRSFRSDDPMTTAKIQRQLKVLSTCWTLVGNVFIDVDTWQRSSLPRWSISGASATRVSAQACGIWIKCKSCTLRPACGGS